MITLHDLLDNFCCTDPYIDYAIVNIKTGEVLVDRVHDKTCAIDDVDDYNKFLPYVITPGGQQINYVCVDAFNGHNDVTGYDALQKDDGTVVWGSAELIVYTCLGDAYNVRVACFNRA